MASPVAKHKKTRFGYMKLKVEYAWATRAGWYLSRGGVTVPRETLLVLSAAEANHTHENPDFAPV